MATSEERELLEDDTKIEFEIEDYSLLEDQKEILSQENHFEGIEIDIWDEYSEEELEELIEKCDPTKISLPPVVICCFELFNRQNRRRYLG